MKSRIKGGGFQGRPGKKGDACYSYWGGGALQVRLSVAFPLPLSLDLLLLALPLTSTVAWSLWVGGRVGEPGVPSAVPVPHRRFREGARRPTW